MNKFRILIYREGCENPIVLSETTEDSKINLTNKLEKVFQSPQICQLKCSSSIYIGRPSKIDAIEVFQETFDVEDTSTIIEPENELEIEPEINNSLDSEDAVDSNFEDLEIDTSKLFEVEEEEEKIEYVDDINISVDSEKEEEE